MPINMLLDVGNKNPSSPRKQQEDHCLDREREGDGEGGGVREREREMANDCLEKSLEPEEQR